MIGEEDRHVIIKSHYPEPLALEVSIEFNGKSTVVPHFSFKRNIDLNDHLTTCGANNYLYKKSDIHFVLTNTPGCIVRVV